MSRWPHSFTARWAASSGDDRTPSHSIATPRCRLTGMRARSLFASSMLGLTLLAGLLPLRGVVAEVVTTNIYLVGEDQVEEEDLYVASTSARIDGTVDGDLTISTGSLLISGTVTGDVLVLSQGTVQVTGDIQGSLRGAARSVIVEGTVGDDVTVAAVSTRISGQVGRDVLAFGGSFVMDGEVGRNVNGRMLSATFNGKVGHDVDIAVGNLRLDGATVVDGDLLYRSGNSASVSSTVSVGSQFERLPARGSWGVELVLTIATVIGFLGFIFAGIVLLWLFRRTAPRAVESVLTRPLRAAGVGVGALVVLPVLILVLMMTLVGVPVAVALLVLFVLGLLFGPVPAVTAIGVKILRSRWGLFASFILGALIWRLGIWLIPMVGFGLYLGALVVGVGGWAVAIWEQRRETPLEADLLPRPKAELDPVAIPSPVGWEAPLAPGSRRDDNPEPEAPHEDD